MPRNVSFLVGVWSSHSQVSDVVVFGGYTVWGAHSVNADDNKKNKNKK